jgi:predicted transcriptional regulator
MKTISAKISDTDYRVLENLAKRKPGSKSAVVRDVVHEFCTRQMAETEQRNAIIDRAFGAFKAAPLDAKMHRENLSETML